MRTEYKGDVDLVTEADRASEKLIVEKLHVAFPNHGIYGEEGTRAGLERGVSLVCRSAGWHDELRAWLSVLLCVAGPGAPAGGAGADQDGEIVAGVIYQPMHNELLWRRREAAPF